MGFVSARERSSIMTQVNDKAGLLPSLQDGDRKVGFAIVGLGRAGHFHLASLKSLGDLAALKCVL